MLAVAVGFVLAVAIASAFLQDSLCRAVPGLTQFRSLCRTIFSPILSAVLSSAPGVPQHVAVTARAESITILWESARTWIHFEECAPCDTKSKSAKYSRPRQPLRLTMRCLQVCESPA